MLTRRKLITSAMVAASFSVLPMNAALAASGGGKTRLDQLVKHIEPVLDLHNSNTRENLKVRFFSGTGYDHQAVREINWFMRDWRQSRAIQIDVRVIWGLAALRHAALKDGNPGLIRVNSGYRTKETNELLRRQGYGAADRSLHLSGKAIDFTMPGASVKDLADYAEWLEIGGTGYYPNRFVHIDSGPARRWVG